MTEFHYLRLARAEYIAKREPRDEWREWTKIAPPEPLRSALVFGAVLAFCFFLARSPQRVDVGPATLGPDAAESYGVPEIGLPGPSSEDNVVDGPWGRGSK